MSVLNDYWKRGRTGEEDTNDPLGVRGNTPEEERFLRNRYPKMAESIAEQRVAHDTGKASPPKRPQTDDERREQEQAKIRRQYHRSMGKMEAPDLARQRAEKEAREQDEEIMRQRYPRMHAKEVLGDPNADRVDVTVDE